MTRILIIGGTGMLGHKLVQMPAIDLDIWSTIRGPIERVSNYGIHMPEKTVENVDVEDFDSVENAINRVQPDVVINAVGVIKQVKDSVNVDTMNLINSRLPHRLAELAVNREFRLICISTDCVFSGERGKYSENDIPDADDRYGQSKYLGEVTRKNCLTIRTSIIGRELATQHSLVEWFLSNRGGRVNGFSNAIYTGFPTVVFARIITDLIIDHPDIHGLFHVSSDPISKFDLLTLINKHFDAGVEIDMCDEPSIDRSLDSTRFRELVGFKPANWESMIEEMAADPTPYDIWRANN